MSKNKKIIIGVSVAVVIIILIGVLFYFFRNNNNGSPQQNNNSFPFGSSGNSTQTAGNQNQNITEQSVVNGVETAIAPAQNGLQKISGSPVSDGNFLQTASTSPDSPTKISRGNLGGRATTTIVRFIERATGHMYEANLESGDITRISNTTVPKIEVVNWGIPGKSFLAQYIDNGSIENRVIEIGGASTSTISTSTPTALETGFLRVNQFDLPQNIISASFSPKGDRLFYLIKGFDGVEGYVSNARGEKPVLVWQFPTTEWLTQWSNGDTVALTSKASNGIPGLLYFLNTKTKAISVVVSNINGLTTSVSPSGNQALYTATNGKTWSTYIYDLKERVSVLIPFFALPEKCVWSKNELIIYCARPKTVSQYAPDDWYRGLASFDDELWKFDFATAEPTRISELNAGTDQAIDLINPHLSPKEDYVVFTNKKDLSFWAFSLK